jgi:hypothetical protein
MPVRENLFHAEIGQGMHHDHFEQILLCFRHLP